MKAAKVLARGFSLSLSANPKVQIILYLDAQSIDKIGK